MNLKKISRNWASLRYWQKGAMLGAGLHLGEVLLIYIALHIFVPSTPKPGDGDMGPPIAWLLLAVSVFVEVVPSIFLYPFTGGMWTVLFPTSIGQDTNFRSIIIWFLYMMYSTIIYALIGVLLAKVIEHREKKTKTSYTNG